MDEKFRQRIEVLVEKVGGQSSLARATNMSLGAIQRYLKGGDPTRLALIRLAKAGNVTLSWLIFGEEGKMQAPAQPKPKMKMYGFGEASKRGWQEPFSFRVRAELDWPDPDCFAVVVGDDVIVQEGIRKDFTCYVSPNTRPQPDDVVYIKNSRGEAGFRKYVSEDRKGISVLRYSKPTREGLQDKTQEIIEQSDIEVIGPVVFVKRR
jgi:transcriptional regulator with XRE-family HTH domain